MIACASIAQATYAYMWPSQLKLKLAYCLVGLTFASGLYLVWQAPAHMLEVCSVGLAYLGGITIGLVMVRSKLIRSHGQQAKS